VGECADTEDSNSDYFIGFLREFGGWGDADFDPVLGRLLSSWHLSFVIKVQTFWRGYQAWQHLEALRLNAPIEDKIAVDTMTGPYTRT
jgi:hypothetical protein